MQIQLILSLNYSLINTYHHYSFAYAQYMFIEFPTTYSNAIEVKICLQQLYPPNPKSIIHYNKLLCIHKQYASVTWYTYKYGPY